MTPVASDEGGTMLAFLHVALRRRTDFSAPAGRLLVLRTEPGTVERWLLLVFCPAVVVLFLGIYAANSAPAPQARRASLRGERGVSRRRG
ncbi:hypothetical protein ACF06V_28335 [Streptomyces bobili]|uniref:hypothetical protein n=1 Tax=Streptomyces bobili TaxID=67280 RepID=UPI0036F9E688